MCFKHWISDQPSGTHTALYYLLTYSLVHVCHFPYVSVEIWRGVTFRTSLWRQHASRTPRKTGGRSMEVVTMWTIGSGSVLWTVVAWWKLHRAGSVFSRSMSVLYLTKAHQQCKISATSMNKPGTLQSSIMPAPSVLWCCCLGGRKGIQPVKNWVVGCWCGYLGWGADLHVAQLMPLPLTISCSCKSRLVLPSWFLPFWYLLTRVVPDKFQKSSKTVVCVCMPAPPSYEL